MPAQLQVSTNTRPWGSLELLELAGTAKAGLQGLRQWSPQPPASQVPLPCTPESLSCFPSEAASGAGGSLPACLSRVRRLPRAGWPGWGADAGSSQHPPGAGGRTTSVPAALASPSPAAWQLRRQPQPRPGARPLPRRGGTCRRGVRSSAVGRRARGAPSCSALLCLRWHLGSRAGGGAAWERPCLSPHRAVRAGCARAAPEQSVPPRLSLPPSPAVPAPRPRLSLRPRPRLSLPLAALGAKPAAEGP